MNGEGQEALACWQLDQIVNDIISDTGADEWQLYISGGKNFRYLAYPEYKGNRVDMVRPMHLDVMREHLATKWKAKVSYKIEADDDCGIAMWRAWENNDENVVLAHIDKDLDMLPGSHYNYNKKTNYFVNEVEAMQAFFTQMILGDKTDNIPGYDGKMRPKVPKFLQPHIDFLYETDDTTEMLAHVYSMYGDWKKFDLSATCLWIWRKENDWWEDWMDPIALKEIKNGDSGEESTLCRESAGEVPPEW